MKILKSLFTFVLILTILMIAGCGNSDSNKKSISQNLNEKTLLGMWKCVDSKGADGTVPAIYIKNFTKSGEEIVFTRHFYTYRPDGNTYNLTKNLVDKNKATAKIKGNKVSIEEIFENSYTYRQGKLIQAEGTKTERVFEKVTEEVTTKDTELLQKGSIVHAKKAQWPEPKQFINNPIKTRVL